MAEKKEEKQVKVNVSFTPEKLFLYGAIADAIVGFLWAILAAAGGDSEGAYKAALFFQGFFFTILGGLVLYGLSLILKGKQ